MRIRLSLFVVFFCFSLLSYGQMFRSVKEFKEFEKRPLLVVLPHTKKEKEKAAVTELQQNIKKNIERHWALQKDVTFMSPDEFRALKKNKKKNTHAVLAFTNIEINNQAASGGTNGVWTSVFVMDLGLSENAIHHVFTYRHNFVSIIPSESEMAGTLLLMQNILKKGAQENEFIDFPKEAKANAEKLRNLTLLIDEQQLEDGITEKAVKELYGLNYKIIPTRELEDAILRKAPGFAYVYMLPNSTRGGNMQLQLVLDTEKSEVVSVSMPPTFKLTGKHSGRRIGERNLKGYVSYINKS
jgi:hypothetical protein